MSMNPEQETPTANVQEPIAGNRRQPFAHGFLNQIAAGWAVRAEPTPGLRASAPYAAARRRAVSEAFPGRRLVVHAGEAKIRSNDMEYAFRALSGFAYLTGWGADTEPGSVLVFDPTGESGHDVTLHFRARADRTDPEFYNDPAIGEFWVGARPALADVEADLGLVTAHIDAFEERPGDLVVGADVALTQFVSELRLIKDDYEIAELRAAVDVTADGFDDIVADLPRIIAHPRGERIVEGVFHQRARADGNCEGYGTIAASGAHACYLHWMRNDGRVTPGDLLLIDAGAELETLYTADITRTIPVSGTFTATQRRVYDAVLEAADAAFAAARPGVPFRALHDAAMAVIAGRLSEWGILPVRVEDALDDQTGGEHRRYMIHGTSHHLGLDVHDCAEARREMYYEGVIQPGMVFTIEPGLYFQADDLTVPESYRGIGVRVEDDIVMTDQGPLNLSAGIPRTADEIENWVGRRS